jgi:MoxR-like ATPase
VLLEGVPGLAKTLTVRTVCDSIRAKFARIQFTPDLLPADLIGTVIYNQRTGEFTSKLGPIFANLILADEINRAPAKVQSALLEAMQERQVTIGDQTYPLPDPFIVMATQNPIEQEGTYPLPEAQLDRFFFKLLVPFPRFKDMETILDRTTEVATPKAERIFDAQRILELSHLVRQIPIANEVRRFAVAIVMGTHPEHELAAPMAKQFVRYGSSPRGAQAIVLAAKLRAIMDGRYNVAREDLRAVTPMALRHRLILNFEGQAENVHPDQVLKNVLETVIDPILVK